MHLSDRFTSGIVPIMAVSVLALYIGLVLYMAIEAWPALIHMSWTDIVTGTVWKPMAQSPVLGLAYIISASLYVSLLSLIWALPLGIGTSVGLSLGVSPWHTMKAIILPSAKGSIILSSVLAFSRAMGETMAVMMVVGNAPILPNLLGKAEPIPSLIALEMGSVEYNSLHYSGLYVAALVLLIILILTNVLVYMYSWKTRKDGHHEVI